VSDPRSLELIRELARDLEPVRPIAPLRRALAGVVLVWAAAAAAAIAAAGVQPQLFAGLYAAPGVAAVLTGLAVAGLGGLVASLALAVPGREDVAQGGLAIGAAGLAVAAGVGTLLFATSPAAAASSWASGSDHLACLVFATAVGVLPAAGVVVFAARAAAARPLVLVLAAAAGAAALGAVAAKASCARADYAHLVVGHVLAPVIAALALALPLLFALRRLQRWPERRHRSTG